MHLLFIEFRSIFVLCVQQRNVFGKHKKIERVKEENEDIDDPELCIIKREDTEDEKGWFLFFILNF